MSPEKRARESVEPEDASVESAAESGELCDEPPPPPKRRSTGSKREPSAGEELYEDFNPERIPAAKEDPKEEEAKQGVVGLDDSPESSLEEQQHSASGGGNRWEEEHEEDDEEVGWNSRWNDEPEGNDSNGASEDSASRTQPGPMGPSAPTVPSGNGAAAGDDVTPGGAAATCPVSVATPERLRMPDRLDMLQECRSKDDFDFITLVGSGTYGLVSKAKDKRTDTVVALKKIKLPESFQHDGFPMTSVREINILLTMHHPNIVNVTEVMTSPKGEVYMVMEFVQQDLKSFIEKYKAKLKIGDVKRIVQQMLQALNYLHDNWVLHRDLKPANILYDQLGNIKICDFGLARFYGDPVPGMTPLVVTRNYRGPEICLGVTEYSPALDIWSAGVIAAELITGTRPFIESKCDIDLVNAIAKVIGSPHGKWEGLEELRNYKKLNILENVPSSLRSRLSVQAEGALPLSLDHTLSETGYDLIEQMLRWDPNERIDAAAALQHPWFDEMPRVTEACFMPQLNDALRRQYN